MTAVGERLLRLAYRLLDAEVVNRVLEPLVADWQYEQRCAATISARRLVAVRWMAAVLWTVLMLSWRAGAASASPGWRAVRAMTLSAAVGLPLLIAPFWSYLTFGSLSFARLTVYLIPQAIALAVPFSLLPGAMVLGASAMGQTVVRARRQLTVAIACGVLVTALGLNWVVPEANQAFRETYVAAAGLTPGPLPRGTRELTIGELWHATGVGPREARRELRARSAIILGWPLTLGLLGWRCGRRWNHMSGWMMMGAWAGAALLVAAVDPLRYLGRDVPTALLPCVWLLVALAVRPRLDVSGPTRHIPSPQS